jgi:hypothetical protein
MEKDKNNCSVFLKYLRIIHFETNQVKMQYKKMNWTDAALAMTYSIGSIICIWGDVSSFAVLALNWLCLWRTFFDNFFNAVQITKLKKTAEVIDKPKEFTYYHIKAGAIILLVIVLFMIAVTLAFEKNNSTNVLRVISSISIIIVLWNDFDNILIRAYNAHII